jgi:NAD(P)-dependent dehydrogenase (short-subunit alcohol dehydrogenase family)
VDNPEKPTTLIIGAGIGIGAATARAFADAGYRVIVTDILEGEGRSVAVDIESGGGEAEYRHLDVTNTDEVDAVVSTVQDRYGPLSVRLRIRVLRFLQLSTGFFLSMLDATRGEPGGGLPQISSSRNTRSVAS